MSYKKHKKGYRKVAWLLFGAYLILMVYFLFFAESMGRTSMGQEYHYNLQPFKEIQRYLTYRKVIGIYALINLAGNVVAFVPFGLFYPLLSRRNRGFWKVTLLSFEVSLLVEIIQLVMRVGSCDVDDILLNTIGGVIGWICFKAAWFLHWKGSAGSANEKKESTRR